MSNVKPERRVHIQENDKLKVRKEKENRKDWRPRKILETLQNTAHYNPASLKLCETTCE
jgi:hypothetical protein